MFWVSVIALCSIPACLTLCPFCLDGPSEWHWRFEFGAHSYFPQSKHKFPNPSEYTFQ